MKRLLCWCISLSLGSTVVGGRWPVVGNTEPVGSQWSVVGNTTSLSPMLNYQPAAADAHQPATDHRPPTTSSQPATDHQPPATNSPATDHLPCTDSSPTCLQTLSDLAVQNSREWAVLGQAIALQKKKLWTNWLSADGLNPLAIALRLARNVAGGGERAAAQLELARLELRRTEVVSELREAVTRAVFAYETAQRELTLAQSRLTVHQTRLAWLTIAYRLGEGNTETMLQLWQQETELQAALQQARTLCAQRRTQLQGIVWPAPLTIIPTIKLSQKS